MSATPDPLAAGDSENPPAKPSLRNRRGATQQAAENMPLIYMTDHRLMAERLLTMGLGGGGQYPVPLQFQVTTATRLADKADSEWASARSALGAYGSSDLSSDMFASLMLGIAELENFVITMGRLLRVHGAILATLGPRKGPSLIATGHEADNASGEVSNQLIARINSFRNRIAHGDEDLAAGLAGNGLPTGIVEALEHRIHIQARSGGQVIELTYDELAHTLSAVRRYLLDVINRS